MYEIEYSEDINVDQAKLKLEEAIVKWKALKIEGKELREKYLLDHHLKELDEKQLQEKERKKLVDRIQRNLQRKYTFHYLTKHVGKGEKGSLKRLHEVDQNMKIVVTHILKEDIENVMFKFNT